MERVVRDDPKKSSSLLPRLECLGNEGVAAKDRAAVALRLLRQAAVANRRSKGQPFYSIRAVARHFLLAPTTVTRLYGQLKTEGILGTIWGSKTIVEPTQLDNDIRLKAMVVLPVPLLAFSALSTYRLFVRGIQRVLWRERFGSQMIFYDEAVFDGSALTDALLETGSDIVIWLMPPLGTSSCFARLRDRGIRSLVITDEMPINGEAGYYLSWQDAVIQGLAEWKRSECAKAVVVKDGDSKSSGALGLMHSCLADAGFVFEIRDRTQLRTSNRSSNPNAGNCGVIFLSAQSLIQFAQAGVDALADLLRHNRVLFIHGGVELPFQTKLNRGFDTIKFDWPAIVRRIVRDLVASRYTNHIEEQTIFKGEWIAGTTRGVVPF
jgi:hypothetical protein